MGVFMQTNSFVHRLTKILVDAMFFSGIICCAASPLIMPQLNRYLFGVKTFLSPFTPIAYSCGLCALFILWQLKAMFKTLLGGNPFIGANVSCLRKCSVASFLFAIACIVDLCFWFHVASLIIAVIFALLGLFCLTLKDVFKQAVAYKEENDWTV